MELRKPEVQFDRDKLLEAVHFVCEVADSERLGAIKLHKVLYFSDMLNFLATGQAITGVEYLKQKFGPTARHLTWAVRKLAEEGTIRVSEADYHGYRKKQFEALKPYSGGRLSVDEKKLLKETVAIASEKTAAELSELSHNAAWESVELGEVIPYSSVYRILPSEIDEDDIAWAETTAKSNAVERFW